MDSKMSNELFTLKRTVATCCVDRCRVPKDPEMSFHSFPKESELRDKWTKALTLDVVEDNLKVCGGHFHSDDFFSTSGEFKVRRLNVKRLKRTAVPSRYLPSSNLEESPGGKDASLVIVKVESLSSPDSPKAKIEAEIHTDENEYAIGTFCCTNCGFIAKSEPTFLEHLYTHVKNEHSEEFEDESQDPLVLRMDDETDLESEANPSQENSDPESGEEQDLDPFDFAVSVLGTHTSNESPIKKLPISNNARSAKTRWEGHVCKFCFRKFYGAPKATIFSHLWESHKEEPEIQRISTAKPLDLREALFRKLIIMGDYFASKFDKTLTICKFLDDPAQDQLVQDTIFGDMSSPHCPQASTNSGWSSVFKKPTIGFHTKRVCSLSLNKLKKPYTRKELIHGEPFFSGTHSKFKKCNYCDFQAGNVCLATAHFQLHAEGKPFGCYGCQKYFESERDLLVQHTTTSHCANILVLNFTLRCPHCLQIFAYKASHLYHTLYEDCGDRR